MNKILILYPKPFNCYTKFSRKVEKIISQLNDISLIFWQDANGLITQFAQEHLNVKELIELSYESFDDITHAIIFTDDEEFTNELNLLEKKGIPLRLIKILITRVINIKIETEYQAQKSTPTYEYIGRGSYWGNPYTMYDGISSREDVIRQFKYDFDYEKFPNKEKSQVYRLAGKRLGCFCKPQACHGDVLADYLNAWDDGK